MSGESREEFKRDRFGAAGPLADKTLEDRRETFSMFIQRLAETNWSINEAVEQLETIIQPIITAAVAAAERKARLEEAKIWHARICDLTKPFLEQLKRIASRDNRGWMLAHLAELESQPATQSTTREKTP